ncbi:hypothetical protein EF888_14650 [Silicimonas algicola]|uniref:Tripartite-type tricarboxylate transporter receptor subunit TctC n=1 Tax=Silicimonas algicola TaxID=1826607 RepID=A0A316G1A8_9RHOB|nr:hypothetical protein [Silicimonas algicola]AZQ68266.1 hypothetical protein EF888_14650 [Silicimonas algicola]PWK54598.1 tripartite-type tricarboxylate transporter receptor subunit TctC [Silicimonas algicola]
MKDRNPMDHLRRRIAAPLAGFALALAAGPLAAQSDTDFAGETVEMIVPYGPGGGTTAFARLFVAPLQDTLQGGPTVLLRNIEGGGSIVGTNEFVNMAETDGRTILAIGASTILNQVFQDPAVRYDLGAMVPIISSPAGTVVYARRDYNGGLPEDPVKAIRVLIENPPVIAAQTLTSSDLGVLLSYDLLGIRPQVVFGISLGESRGGLERGEFQMRHDTMLSYANAVVPLIEDGVVQQLFTMGYEQDGVIGRDPVAPDVPTFLEVYEAVHGEPLDGIEYQVWKSLFDIRVTAGKMILLPEGTPADMVAAYEAAITDAMDHPDLTSAAAQEVMGDYPQLIGAEATGRVLTGALSLSGAPMDWLQDWADDRYGGF